MASRLQIKILIQISLFVGALFFLAGVRGVLPSGFVGVQYLSWEELVGCSSGGVPEDHLGREGSVGSYNLGNTDSRGLCQSAPFDLQSDVLEIALAGLTLPKRYIDKNPILFHQSDNTPLPVTFVSSRSVSGWNIVRLRYDSARDVRPGSVFIRLVGDDTRKGWVGLRNRVVFLSPPWPDLPLLSVAETGSGLFIAGIFLCLSIFQLFSQVSSPRSVFFLYLLTAFVFHFRFQLFFHWDEWHVLERFLKQGLPGVVYTHNEHFLPFYFLYLYLQRLFFGIHYLPYVVCGIIVHSFNALILATLFSKLLKHQERGDLVARILGFVFVISSLHSEVLQWAFEQTVLLSMTAMLLGFLAALRYLENQDRRSGVVLCLAATTAPFLFGNGFVFPGYCALILLVALLLRDDVRRSIPVRLVAVLGLYCVMGCGIAAIGYVLNTSTAGHGVGQTSPLGNIPELLAYMFVGAEFGTALRGVGLFPSLELGAAAVAVPAVHGIRPEVLLGLAGFAVSLVLSVLSMYGRSARVVWGLFVAGQLWLLGSMLLPAFARWQLGITQALSLRYCYAAFPGLLMLLVFPLLRVINAERSLSRFLGKGLILLIIVSNLFSSARFTYFVENGELNRLYISELQEWQEILTTHRAKSFEGAGTKYFGAYPLMPPGLTPGRHPNEILQVVRYLTGKADEL